MTKLVTKIKAEKATPLDERHLAELLEILRAIAEEARASGESADSSTRLPGASASQQEVQDEDEDGLGADEEDGASRTAGRRRG